MGTCHTYRFYYVQKRPDDEVEDNSAAERGVFDIHVRHPDRGARNVRTVDTAKQRIEGCHEGREDGEVTELDGEMGCQ